MLIPENKNFKIIKIFYPVKKIQIIDYKVLKREPLSTAKLTHYQFASFPF